MLKPMGVVALDMLSRDDGGTAASHPQDVAARGTHQSTQEQPPLAAVVAAHEDVFRKLAASDLPIAEDARRALQLLEEEDTPFQ